MSLSSSTPLPGTPGKGIAVGRGSLDIVRTLAPVRRSIGLRRVARWTLLGCAAGAVIGACLLIAGRIWAFDFVVTAALLALVIGALGGMAAGVARWPATLEAARAADLHFELDDRLTTALELRSSDAVLAVLQREDVAQRIGGLHLGQSHSRWLTRREGAGMVLAAVAFAGALALGTPKHVHTTSAAARSTTERAKRAAAAQIQHLTSQLHVGLTPGQQHTEAIRRLDQALARLRQALLHASSRRTALRAISTTQQQLQQAARGLHPINSRAVAQLNSSLGRNLQQGKAGTSARAARNSSRTASRSAQAASRSARATAQALNRLAQSLAHLTAAQRAELARNLLRASNATSSTMLRSQLQQAAQSLANNDAQSSRSALQAAAQALAQSAGAQASLARLAAAQGALSAMKNSLSGIPGTIPANGPSASAAAGAVGTAGKNGKRGAGSQPGTGRGSGTRRGTQPGAGRGRGAGRGQGTGRFGARGQGWGTNGRGGTAAQGGKGTAGAHGSGGVGRAGRTRSGRKVTVYVPGQQGKGQNIIQNGPNGAPQAGAVVPYQQVIGRYAQSAHQALDRTALPPSLQNYVRRYFDTLSR